MAILNRDQVLALNTELRSLAGAAFSFGQVDPYLKWALLTNFEGHSNAWSGGQLPFLIFTPDKAKAASDLDLKGISINGAYVSASQGNPRYGWATYSTALVKRESLVVLHDEIVKDRGGACKLGLPSSAMLQMKPAQFPAGVHKTPVVAVIDHAIAFSNSTFSDSSGATRIRVLWDQDPHSKPRPIGPPSVGADWERQDKFGYGAVIRSTAINNAKAYFQSEEELYIAAAYKPVLRRVGHGTHVLDLAAGKKAWPSLPDQACAADIWAVQLPATPYKDTSGGSLCVHILDALQWFKLSTDETQPVVANISDGAYAGPSRGRSLLERAMANFVGLSTINGTPRFHLLIAAGNGALRRGRAHGSLKAQAKSGPIHLKVLPDTPTDTFVEIWIDSEADLAKYVGDVLISVVSPFGELVSTSKSSNLGAIVGRQNRPLALLSASDESPDSPKQLGFLLTISPTKRLSTASRRESAPHGLWTMEVTNSSAETIEFTARIQRSNPALGDKGNRREAEFVKTGAQKSRVPEEDTLNNIATGSAGIVVGGHLKKGQDWPDPSKPYSRNPQARYSSRGSAVGGVGRKVDVIAASDESLGLRGILASSNRSGTKVRMDGTSVATPQVARALFNALAASGNGSPTDAFFLAHNTDPVGGSSEVPPKLREGT
jgi:hypothetical protein